MTTQNTTPETPETVKTQPAINLIIGCTLLLFAWLITNNYAHHMDAITYGWSIAP